jgi:hypothetical protein
MVRDYALWLAGGIVSGTLSLEATVDPSRLAGVLGLYALHAGVHFLRVAQGPPGTESSRRNFDLVAALQLLPIAVGFALFFPY